MPNTKSAKKRLRQNIANRTSNRSIRSSVRTQIRKVRRAIAAGDVKASETELRLAAQELDKAAVNNAIHFNAAARTKSRLASAIKGIK